MKRYNITIASGFNNQRRIKITSADNGEWVRYEDVADALEQAKNLLETDTAVVIQPGIWYAKLDRIAQLEIALTRCVGEIEESLEFEGVLASFREAARIGLKILKSSGDDEPKQIPESYGGTNG